MGSVRSDDLNLHPGLRMSSKSIIGAKEWLFTRWSNVDFAIEKPSNEFLIT
jgi:hypothetical protein